jgi:hypothetical protein
MASKNLHLTIVLGQTAPWGKLFWSGLLAAALGGRRLALRLARLAVVVRFA